MSINRVNLSGNLGSDAELRTTQGGTAILSFSLAVNDRRKNPSSGEWEDYTNWVSCVMFGARAEKLAQYLSRGSKVAVEGKLRWSQWEKDGQKRSKIEVVVDEIEFMSRQQQGQQGGYQQQPTYSAPTRQQPTYQPQQQAYQQQPVPQAGLYDEESIPF